MHEAEGVNAVSPAVAFFQDVVRVLNEKKLAAFRKHLLQYTNGHRLDSYRSK